MKKLSLQAANEAGAPDRTGEKNRRPEGLPFTDFEADDAREIFSASFERFTGTKSFPGRLISPVAPGE